MSDKREETQTRSPEIQDVSSFHWLWRLGACFLIPLDITDTWGSHVPQIMREKYYGTCSEWSLQRHVLSGHSTLTYLLLTTAWEAGMLIKESWRKQGHGKVAACLWGYRPGSGRSRGLTVHCGSRAYPLDQHGLLWLRSGHPGGSHRSSSGWPQLILLLIPKGCSALRVATFLPRPNSSASWFIHQRMKSLCLLFTGI